MYVNTVDFVAIATFLAVMPVLASERQYEWVNVARIVAVGDVHGDYDKMVQCLNGVIDDSNKWIGGKTHLVQTGDVLDKGPDLKKALVLNSRQWMQVGWCMR